MADNETIREQVYRMVKEAGRQGTRDALKPLTFLARYLRLQEASAISRRVETMLPIHQAAVVAALEKQINRQKAAERKRQSRRVNGKGKGKVAGNRGSLVMLLLSVVLSTIACGSTGATVTATSNGNGNGNDEQQLFSFRGVVESVSSGVDEHGTWCAVRLPGPLPVVYRRQVSRCLSVRPGDHVQLTAVAVEHQGQTAAPRVELSGRELTIKRPV